MRNCIASASFHGFLFSYFNSSLSILKVPIIYVCPVITITCVNVTSHVFIFLTPGHTFLIIVLFFNSYFSILTVPSIYICTIMTTARVNICICFADVKRHAFSVGHSPKNAYALITYKELHYAVLCARHNNAHRYYHCELSLMKAGAGLFLPA